MLQAYGDREPAPQARETGGALKSLVYLEDPDFTLYNGHVIDCLKELPDHSVDSVVTSPPYWGLRNYGVPPQAWGLDSDCDHQWVTHNRRGMSGGTGDKSPLQKAVTRSAVMFDSLEFKACTECGGWLVPLGLEPTPELFVKHLCLIFDEVHRVLKDRGTIWVNLGDSYAEKQLVGVPWMFFFAMKERGWIARRDIIWSKPNPMPESARDRCTTAHEYIFHFAKNTDYYYDADSIREPHTSEPIPGWQPTRNVYGPGVKGTKGPAGWHELGRNKRSVWEIPVQPYEEAHFATFPSRLIEPCILAGCPEKGVVLDPFMGSGTTAVTARNLGRRSVGIELNAEYCEIIVRRTKQLSLDFAYDDTMVVPPTDNGAPGSSSEGTANHEGIHSSAGPGR